MTYASDAYRNTYLHVNCQLWVSEFNDTWREPTNFSNTRKYPTSCKIPTSCTKIA